MMRKGSSLDFTQVHELSLSIARGIEDNRDTLLSVLTSYETYKTAEDEIERTLDLLINLDENDCYFKQVVGPVAVFLPSNQPLYSFACFAIVPALMSERVCVKAPEIMESFFGTMLEVLKVPDVLPNIEHMKLARKECLDIFTATSVDSETNHRYPVFEAVIFTGTTENADKLRKSFHRSTLFITNGSGHNPVIVTPIADLQTAVDGIVSLRTYNQGQDCAAPNAILVHASVYDSFLERLRTSVSALKVGAYASPETDIGPISRPETLTRVEEFFIENSKYIDTSNDGIIRARTQIIEPTILSKPLKDGANYDELFAPVFIVQRYDHDRDLKIYFEDARYKTNAMYVTIYGQSAYMDDFLRNSNEGKQLHDATTILFNTDLHKPGVERGVKPYGGYGRGASCISKDGVIISCPTLPQRELFNYLVCGVVLGGKTVQKVKQHKSSRSQNHSGYSAHQHWGKALADQVIEKFPVTEMYTCASGISPSGTVHFGNFRDLFTSYVVSESLQQKGKKARLLLSWDDFDRFSKVPENVDASFEQYIGLPYSKVPCPDGIYTSYAEKFEKEFEKSLLTIGIHPEFTYQTKMYESGKYDDHIIMCLQNRESIAEILLSYMSSERKITKSINDGEYKRHYYPVVLYSRFTGKDNTRILDYDGTSIITYKCFDTGNVESIDITKEHIVKLSWKVDWPMRWGMENVAFEPGGADHASPGGSFDVSSKIAQQILDIDPPVLREYKFIGLRGVSSRVSSIQEGFTSLNDLLTIYTPEILKWQYASKSPHQSFELSFGKDIFRQYDEFDKIAQNVNSDSMDSIVADALKLSGVEGGFVTPPIPFRQLVGLGQAVQWDSKKLEVLLASQKEVYEPTSIAQRMPRAKAWLEHNDQEKTIRLLAKRNKKYLSGMSDDRVKHIWRLHNFLYGSESLSVKDIETEVYAIPKEKGVTNKELMRLQKSFFVDIYNLLIGEDAGPRLSTFLWAADRKEVMKLLNVEEIL